MCQSRCCYSCYYYQWWATESICRRRWSCESEKGAELRTSIIVCCIGVNVCVDLIVIQKEKAGVWKKQRLDKLYKRIPCSRLVTYWYKKISKQDSLFVRTPFACFIPLLHATFVLAVVTVYLLTIVTAAAEEPHKRTTATTSSSSLSDTTSTKRYTKE